LEPHGSVLSVRGICSRYWIASPRRSNATAGAMHLSASTFGCEQTVRGAGWTAHCECRETKIRASCRGVRLHSGPNHQTIRPICNCLRRYKFPYTINRGISGG
jgi:hypothetical protein